MRRWRDIAQSSITRENTRYDYPQMIATEQVHCTSFFPQTNSIMNLTVYGFGEIAQSESIATTHLRFRITVSFRLNVPILRKSHDIFVIRTHGKNGQSHECRFRADSDVIVNLDEFDVRRFLSL